MTIQPEERYEQLTHRYLSGEASPMEISELEDWVQADRAHRRYFVEAKKAWMAAEAIRAQAPIDVNSEWSAFQQAIQQEDQDQKEPETPVVPLRTSHRRQRYIPWMAAASILLLIVAGLWWMRPASNGPQEYLAQTEIVQENLPDGSSISLNRDTRVTYEPTPDKRLVQLRGEAFFDVKRDESKPFIIQTGTLEIEVLGTSFNVDARADSPVSIVTVTSGKVAVRSGQNTVSLIPEEQAIFNRQTGSLQKQQNQNPNYRSWQTQQLIFDDTPLDSVVLALEKQFKVEINFADQALKNCRLTATYTNKSLDVIIQILEKTFGLEAKKRGKKIRLSGKGCPAE